VKESSHHLLLLLTTTNQYSYNIMYRNVLCSSLIGICPLTNTYMSDGSETVNPVM